MPLLFGACRDAQLAAPVPRGTGPISQHDIQIVVDPYHSSLQLLDRMGLNRDQLGGGSIKICMSPGADISGVRVDGVAALYAPSSPLEGWPKALTTYEIEVPEKGKQLEVEATVTLDRGDGRPGAISATGAFLPGEAGWYPMRPGEPAAYKWSIIAEASWALVGPGRTVSSELEGDQQQASFAADTELGDLDLVLAPLTRTNADAEGSALSVEAWFSPEAAEDAGLWVSAATRQLEHVQRYLGPVPSRLFKLIEVPRLIAAELDPWPMDSGLIVNQAWLATPWQADRRALDAALSTVLGKAQSPTDEGDWRGAVTTLLHAEAPIEGLLYPSRAVSRESWLRDWREGQNAQDERPLIEPGPDTAVRFARGAMVLHMLSQWMGEGTFREGLHIAAAGAAQGRTGWSDMQAAMESAGRAPLDWFFDPWLSRLGAPRLTLAEVEVEQLKVQGREGPVQALKVRVTRDGFTGPVMVPVSIEMTRGHITQLVPMDGPEFRVSIPLTPLTPREIAALERGHMPPPDIKRRTGADQSSLGGSGAGSILGEPMIVRVDPSFDVLRELWPQELLPRIGDVLKDRSIQVMAGEGRNMVPSASLAAALMGRSTIDPAMVASHQASSLIVVADWSAVSGGQIAVGPLNLTLPRDLRVDGDVLWHGMTAYTARTVSAVLAVPHPAQPRQTLLVILTHDEQTLSQIMPFLSEVALEGYALFHKGQPAPRGRYEPGAHPLMKVLGASDGPRLDEPAAW